MVYGHEAVLSVEVNLAAYILAKQNDLYGIMYHELMMDNVDRWLVKEWRLWDFEGDQEKQNLCCQGPRQED